MLDHLRGLICIPYGLFSTKILVVEWSLASYIPFNTLSLTIPMFYKSVEY